VVVPVVGVPVHNSRRRRRVAVVGDGVVVPSNIASAATKVIKIRSHPPLDAAALLLLDAIDCLTRCYCCTIISAEVVAAAADVAN